MNASELEYRLLFSMVVAGKSASFAEAALERFFETNSDTSPFRIIRTLSSRSALMSALRDARTGNYQKLSRGFDEISKAEIDLRTCTAEQLERIHGIGPKTSRFFIIWTRPDAKHAALDTHVLKWLRYLGHTAPKSTPSGKDYSRLEKIILAEAEKRAMTPRELDSSIWDWCSTGKNNNGQWPYNLQITYPHA